MFFMKYVYMLLLLLLDIYLNLIVFYFILFKCTIYNVNANFAKSFVFLIIKTSNQIFIKYLSIFFSGMSYIYIFFPKYNIL